MTRMNRLSENRRLRRLAEVDVVHLFRRYGLYVASAAFLVGLKWRGGYDLEPFLAAARDVAAGLDPYAATDAVGIAEWGTSQVFVSPPFVALLLSPFASLPKDVVFAGWSITGLLAVLGALRLVERDLLVAQAPRLVFSFVYLWASVFLGQVNLFVLAGLLLALGSRRDAVSGLGLALAIAMRASPAAFALVLVLDRRWRALAWAAAGMAGVVLLQPVHWVTFVRIAREAAVLPTLDVPVQTSIASVPLLPWLVAGAIVIIVAGSMVAGRQRTLLAGAAIGLGLVLLPSNAWYHWFTFGLAPLLLFGERARWSRVAVIAFVAASFLPMGWPSVGVALAVIAVMTFVAGREIVHWWRTGRPRRAAILGRP